MSKEIVIINSEISPMKEYVVQAAKSAVEKFKDIKLIFLKENEETRMKYGVATYHTIIFFDNGRPLYRADAPLGKEDFERLISLYFAKRFVIDEDETGKMEVFINQNKNTVNIEITHIHPIYGRRMVGSAMNKNELNKLAEIISAIQKEFGGK